MGESLREAGFRAGQHERLGTRSAAPLRLPARIVYAFFFLSGVTALTFEVAWSKQLSYVLGNTLYAISTVVAAFMAGLALGSGLASRFAARIERPIAFYGWIQLGIAAWGAVSIPMFDGAEPLFRVVYQASEPGSVGFLLARFAVVFLLMLPPAALMGMTLPVLTNALARGKSHYDLQAGLLYGVNTMGAVAGTWCAGFFLISGLGVRGTTWAAAAIDVAVGLACILGDRRPVAQKLPATAKEHPIADDVRRGESRWTRRHWILALLFGCSGAVALLLEIGWFRLLGLSLGPSVYAFSAMLASYLAGIGIGSAAAAPWIERRKASGLRSLLELEGALAVVSLAGLLYFNQLPGWSVEVLKRFLQGMGVNGFAVGQLAVAAAIVLPSCLLLGAIFPSVVRAARELDPTIAAGTTVGRLYLANTLGSIVGSLATGFVLLPWLGAWKTLQLGGLLCAGLSVGFALLGARRSMAWLPWPIAAVALAALAPEQDVARYNQGLYRQLHASYGLGSDPAREQLVFHREGINCSVAVFRTYGGAALYVSGKPDASTNRGDLQTQLFAGHFPILLCREPERVALVGYGSGMTAAAILTYPQVQALDVMEIEKSVIEASPFFSSINDDPFDDPRVRLLVEDGRTHLTYTSEKYDVIVSEPSNPWMAGIASLFTTDFYARVQDRLEPGGVFAQWIQNYQISPEVFRVILASLHETFPHLIVFRLNVGDFLVLASQEPLEIPWGELVARFEQPSVRASFRELDVRDVRELFFFFQGPEEPVLAEARASRERNTDDNAWLEHRMPRELLNQAGDRHVGLLLSQWGSEDRIRGFSRLAPGAPLSPILRVASSYPYRLEPIVAEGRVFPDPWHDTRRSLEEGLRRELSELRATGAAVPPPDSLDRWLSVANAYLVSRTRAAASLIRPATGSAEDASQRLSDALQLAPDLPYARCLQGRALLTLGRVEEATIVFESLLEHPASPAYLEAVMALAQIAHARGRLDEAAAWCARLVEHNPYVPTPHLMLADLHRRRGDRSAARAALAAGLAHNPRDADLLRMRIELE